MDLTKLADAPWVAWEIQQSPAQGGMRVGGLTNEQNFSPLIAVDHSVALDPDFAAFAALARNAMDVMMRRGWSPTRTKVAGRPSWFVRFWAGSALATILSRERLGYVHYHADPFTALVEADKWYKASVEKTS